MSKTLLVLSVLCFLLNSEAIAQDCSDVKLEFNITGPFCEGVSFSLQNETQGQGTFTFVVDGTKIENVGRSIQYFEIDKTGEVEIYMERKINNCTDKSAVKKITIKPLPTNLDFSFSSNNGSPPCSETFIDFEYTGDAGNYSYLWKFGDGEVAEGKTTSHQFKAFGNAQQSFNVELEVTDNGTGCTGIISKQVNVIQRPDATLYNINDFINCNGEDFVVDLVDRSSTSDTNTKYRIRWGDRNYTDENDWDYSGAAFPASGAESHTYTALDIFTLTYEITGANGCIDTREYEVVNITNPAISVGSPGNTIGCSPKEFPFNVSGFESNHPSTTYTVDFGDGSDSKIYTHDDLLASGGTIEHTYKSNSCEEPGSNIAPPGTFTFSITASNACSFTPATVGGIKIYGPPDADIAVIDSIICVGEEVTFNNVSSDGFNSACNVVDASYDWIITKEGTEIDRVSNIIGKSDHQYTFTESGTYEVELIAKGCNEKNHIQTIIVNEPAAAIFDIIKSNTTEVNGCDNDNPILFSLTGNDACSPILALDASKSVGEALTYTWTVTPFSSDSYSFGSNGNTTSRLMKDDIAFTKPGNYTISLEVDNGCNTSTACVQVQIEAPPQIENTDLNINKQDICGPQEVSFFTNFTATGITYKWELTKGGVSIPLNNAETDATDPVNLDEGSYEIKLIISNACGDSEEAKNFDITAAPIADAGQDLVICLNDNPIALNGTPTNGQWSGPGVSSNNFDPAVAGVGIHTITYLVGTANCSGSDTKTIEVKPVPEIDFTIAPEFISVCVDQAAFDLTANVNTTGSGVWSGTGITDPDNGTFDPTIAGASATGHTITYTFTPDGDDPKCEVSSSIAIKVNELPEIDLSGIPDLLCFIDEDILLTGHTPVATGTSEGAWSGDGVINDAGEWKFNPFTAGLGVHQLTYTFTDENLCVQSASKDITVEELSTIDIGPDLEICINDDQFTLQSTATPEGGSWSSNNLPANTLLPDGSINLRAAGVGDYEVTYTIGTGSCETSETKNIRILPLPNVYAGAPIQDICISDPPINLGDDTEVSPLGGTWSGTGITNATIGTFDPVLAATGMPDDTPFTIDVAYTFIDPITNCDSTHIKEITINPLPKTEFELLADPVYCINQPYIINNITPALIGQTIEFKWDFGDGNLVSANSDDNGEITFTTSGAKQISLYAYTEVGCENVITKNIEVVEPASPSFTKVINPADGCGPVNVSFTNTSSGFQPVYSWNFGNGNTSNEANPTDQEYLPSYFQDTTYYITLTVNNLCSPVEYYDSVIVKPFPTPDFVFDRDTICADFPMPIYNTSYGLPESFAWDFGDGTQNVNRNDDEIITHSFPYTGQSDTTYVVTLTAINQCDSRVIQKEIVVIPNKIDAGFGVNNIQGCSPFTVNFNSNQQVVSDNIHIWTFDMENEASTSIIGSTDEVYTYTQPGTYQARLIVFNDCHRDTTYKDIEVLESPIVELGYSANTICKGESIQFTNNSTVSLGASFDYGDGSPIEKAANALPHQYNVAGTYYAKLFVTDPLNGCTGIDSVKIIVDELPVASFDSPTDICPGDTAIFVSTSSDAFSYSWSFDATGGRKTDAITNFIYYEQGEYTVTLWAYSKGGCVDSTSKIINVIPAPEPDFDFEIDYGEDECSPIEVSFENLTQYPSSGQGIFSWDFGNGETYEGYAVPDPIRFVNFSGIDSTFVVTLYATSGFGCTEIRQKPIEVCSTFEIPNAFTPNGDGVNDDFKPLIDQAHEYIFQVFSRTGEKVYESDDPMNRWDGTHYQNGKECQQGVYIYKFQITNINGASTGAVTGQVLLIR